jgi:SAM-dependent methyltransferase
MSETRRLHELNRVAWDQAAARYTEWHDATVAFINEGKANLEPAEREHLGDLRAVQRAIHLQCASGKDTLSLLNLGAAEAVGVDISAVHIKNARALVEATRKNAHFVQADVLDTPASLDGTADLVYTGKGALTWLHDIAGWASVVARLLAPGGRLFVHDGHPAIWLFDPQATTVQLVKRPRYFQLVETSTSWPAQYVGDVGNAPMVERSWTLGEVVTAVARAGLVVERLTEHAEDYWDGFPHLADSEKGLIPLTFSLLARKPHM